VAEGDIFVPQFVQNFVAPPMGGIEGGGAAAGPVEAPAPCVGRWSGIEK